MSQSALRARLGILLLPVWCVVAAMLSACGTVPIYVDAAPRYSLPVDAPRDDAAVIVHLESVFTAKRFDELVCDNVTGVIWSPEESTKIGFTQNPAEIMAKTAPLMVMEASLPHNLGIGRVASGQSSLAYDRVKIDSRIMIPFGAYISRNLEQLLSATSPSSKVCFDTECVRSAGATGGARLVTVQFTKFKVAEDNPNKLTLEVEGVVAIEGASRQSRVFPVKYEIIDRSISSEGYRHADFLRVMNKLANESASAIAKQILSGANSLP
jgi:hypothetical protein